MVATWMEMSVKPHRATNCSLWAVTGHSLGLVKVSFVVVKCCHLGYCQML